MGKFEDLTGRTFGKLRVIRRGESLISPNGNYITRWLCQCDCGSEPKLVRAGHLKNGSIRSCGCLSRETTSAMMKKGNIIKEFDGYCIGYTAKGEEFYFDKEDCDLVKKYCWYIDNLGYVATNIVTDEGKRTVLRMHTLIMQPSDSALKIDHIHGRESRNDNRKYNLRIATNQENSINAGLKSNNTSGVTGVGWDKRYGKWQARIKKNYKSIHLGYFDAFEDAVNARKEAEEKYFGEFAYDYSQQMEVEV